MAGGKSIAITAMEAKPPTLERRSDILPCTLESASETAPPTTGKTAPAANFAVLSVTLSAAPARDPFKDKSPTNTVIKRPAVTVTIPFAAPVMPFPAVPVSVPQSVVDIVCQVPRLGDPKKIVSSTTKITTDPIGLQIAKYAAMVIESTGYVKNGFSFQTGTGGISLAVAEQRMAS